jgi:molybdopterin-synthase adenylyltransferase
MKVANPNNLARYARQAAFDGLGPAGQKAIASGRALIVGVGGLGSWAAELLARAGVGSLRLADPDKVDLSNIHRQALYSEADAAAGLLKVEAARRRLGEINSGVAVETAAERVDHRNIARLAAGAGVIVDGTDNFAARFLINDYAVKSGTPWVFAGCIRAEWQTMAVLPGRSPCLRCLMDAPPPPCTEQTCRQAGVIGPAVAAVAAFQAAEAMKILAGRADLVSPYLLKADLWANALQRLAWAEFRNLDCPCCAKGEMEYLEP